jgi:RNA polymerase sigma-70 factor (ECF subfamily)
MAIEGVESDGVVHDASDSAADLVPDASLIRAVIKGSQEALAGLYDKHGNAVFAAAMRASGDRSIAAEVVQETFLALWNRAELFDPARGNLPAWLVTIARNRAIDRVRAASRHDRASSFSSFAATEADDHSIGDWLTASGELIGVGGPEPLPEVALTDKETRASIAEALASLDPTERRVILLAYDGGLTQSEIAATLGWPIGTVKTRTRRALRHLRDWLERCTGGVLGQGKGVQPVTNERSRSPQSVIAAVGRECRKWPAPVDHGCSGAIALPCQ